jgi:integrase
VRRHSGHSGVMTDTFASVIRAYTNSPNFNRLADSTKQIYRVYLTKAEVILGDLPLGVIRPFLVQQCLDALADRPGAQSNMRTVLKAIEAFALPRDLLPNPITLGTEVVGSDGGHKPWTEDQVQCAERFAAPHVARIITIASNTGQRGSDLCRMRWSDIETIDGRPGIHVKQRKTGLQIWIPFTSALMHAIATWQRGPTHILLQPNGLPYGNRMALSRTWDRERNRNPNLAPCAGMVLHGLRATAVIRLRRAGATTPQIVDMIGLSAEMVERYSRFADQKVSALAAVLKLDRTGIEQERQIMPRNPKINS